LTKGILDKYPNLERINEHSHDVDNEESFGYSQNSQNLDLREINSDPVEKR
jgi:hypothetical protein